MKKFNLKKQARNLNGKSDQIKNQNELLQPITKELIGMIKVKNKKRLNSKEIITNFLIEKYLRKSV